MYLRVQVLFLMKVESDISYVSYGMVTAVLILNLISIIIPEEIILVILHID